MERQENNPESRTAPSALGEAGQVGAVRETMPSNEDIADLADVFGLLGEPTRVRLLIALLSGPMRVRDLAAVIGLSESATSHSLRLLRAHRVVDVHRNGRTAMYDLSDAHVRTLLALGLDHVGHTVLIHVASDSADAAPPCHDSATS